MVCGVRGVEEAEQACDGDHDQGDLRGGRGPGRQTMAW